jgi:hypothetical protein
MCSLQQQMVAPALLRGDELSRLQLRSLMLSNNLHTKPLPQKQLVICIEHDKVNAYGEKLTLRGLTYHPNLVMCPLLSMALVFLQRTCCFNGRPISEKAILRGDWCARQFSF